MNQVVIYKITSPSGRIYIGQTNNYARRIKIYQYTLAKNQTILNKSFIKYGFINHKFEIIEECISTELNVRERYWIDFYKSNNYRYPKSNGMNCNDGGCGSGVCSDERKDKISKANKGRQHSIDSKNKMSLIAKRRREVILSDEDIIKLINLYRDTNITIIGLAKIFNIKRNYILEIFKLNDINVVKKNIPGELNGNRKSVIDTETGKIFNTIKSASNEIGIASKTLSFYLNNPEKNKTTYKYTNKNF